MRNHVTALGWIHIVLDGLGLIMGILLLFLFLGIGGAISATGGHDAAPALPVLGVIGTFLLGLFAVLSIPGLIAGIGLLNFAFQRAHEFNAEEKQLAQTAANQLAMALTNARLIRAQERQIQTLTDHSKFSLWCGTVHSSETLQRQAIEKICKIARHHETPLRSDRCVRSSVLRALVRIRHRVLAAKPPDAAHANGQAQHLSCPPQP